MKLIHFRFLFQTYLHSISETKKASLQLSKKSLISHIQFQTIFVLQAHKVKREKRKEKIHDAKDVKNNSKVLIVIPKLYICKLLYCTHYYKIPCNVECDTASVTNLALL